MKSESGRRAFAGVWFAVLAAIPVAFFFLFLWQETERQKEIPFYWIFIGGPILLGGICGCFLGSSILDPAKVKTSGQAMLRGLMVSSLAFVLFFVMSPLIIALTSKDPARSLSGWGLIVTFAIIYVGWLVAIVGAVGGAFLYFYRVMSAADSRAGEWRRN
jgi:heme A synthase